MSEYVDRPLRNIVTRNNGADFPPQHGKQRQYLLSYGISSFFPTSRKLCILFPTLLY